MTPSQELLAEAYRLNFGTPQEQKEALEAISHLTNVIQHETLNTETKKEEHHASLRSL